MGGLRPGDLLEIDWEVGVFKAVRALWVRLFPAPPPYDAGRAAVLADHLRPLELLAQLVAGEAVSLKPARVHGGVRGRDLLVPAWVDRASAPEENRGLLLLRVVHAAAMRRVSRDLPLPQDEGERLRASLRAVDQATDVLRGELPLFGPAWDEAVGAELLARPSDVARGRPRRTEALRAATLRGERPWADPSLFAGLADERGPDGPPVLLFGALLAADTEDATSGRTPDQHRAPSAGTEHEAPAVEDLRRVLLDPEEQEQKVLTHTFEKVETLDAWEGTVQREDGSDELDEHLEALQEVDLRSLIRGGQEAGSVLRADLDLKADIPDVESIAPGEHGLAYDEWDHRAARYRLGWCTVYPTPVRATRPSWAAEARSRHQRLIARLQRRLADHRSRLAPRPRQLDGEHPDLDALVDHLADVRAGRTGDGRLYVRQQRHLRDVVTTVLLDVSLSTDGWVADRRVLDVAREAVLVLGDVAHRLGDRMQVLAFASATRNRCRVLEIKRWNEPWAVGAARLGAIEPMGYTRIGPALRHATADLARQAADARLLLLISDGKPNDHDRYEGPYGIADVRMALREANGMGVATHALAIDPSAVSWLPRMLGAGRWHVTHTPDALLPALSEVYGRWTGR
ncbi:MAG: VWA domain-containing protein [Myxococcales bacterium]|nr:VWA domain-containing protein [Myxococcales bacterium]